MIGKLTIQFEMQVWVVVGEARVAGVGDDLARGNCVSHLHHRTLLLDVGVGGCGPVLVLYDHVVEARVVVHAAVVEFIYQVNDHPAARVTVRRRNHFRRKMLDWSIAASVLTQKSVHTLEQCWPRSDLRSWSI